MEALPAEAPALEADAVVAAVALKHADTVLAPSAKITVMELETSLLKLGFAGQNSIHLLKILVVTIDGPDKLDKLSILPL